VARRIADDDEWDDEDEAFEDDADDEDQSTVERYISDEDAPRSRKSWLIIIGTLLCFYIVYHWIVG
jgi:hypothetical protein